MAVSGRPPTVESLECCAVLAYIGQSASRARLEIAKANRATIARVATGKTSPDLKDRFVFLTGGLARPSLSEPPGIRNFGLQRRSMTALILRHRNLFKLAALPVFSNTVPGET